MANVFIFTAADTVARDNFRKSVENGVLLQEILPAIAGESERQRITAAYPDGRAFFWGAQEKSGENRTTWAKIAPGDLILGYRSRSIISAGFAVSTIENAQIANSTWTSTYGGPFNLIFFFTKPLLCNVPLSTFPNLFGEEYRGFTTVSAPRVSELLARFGSFENFVSQLDGHLAPTSSPLPAELRHRYWVEKTLVSGRPDGEKGPHALGVVLWSPTRSTDGANVYRQMQDVSPGDVVFHLIDNDRIAGVSLAVGRATDDFVGLEGTDWAGRQCYRIPLQEYIALEPPLRRETFLRSEELRPALLELLNTEKGLFYNRDLALRQGAYLTEAPPRLVAMWNEMYKKQSGTDLPHVNPAELASDGRPTTPRPTAPRPDLRAVAEDFGRALTDAGVTFGSRHDDVVRSFVASLATKRFVILTGLSGSGKTQIALRFGEWLGRKDLVAVRPDWTGAESVFGYEDVLRAPDEGGRSWHVPAALEFMLSAARDPDRPYLLILDEMNLAHVERYLADLLSGMESQEPCLPNLVRTKADWKLEVGADEKICVPPNLFLVGTVNVDETTYMFSPKVLDRANTIEFRVATDELVVGGRRPRPCSAGPDDLVFGFLSIASDDGWQDNHPANGLSSFTERLRLLHRLLAADGFEFGHRVFFEAIRFASLFAAAGNSEVNEALDYQVLQKVLPRLHGSRKRLEPVLCALGRFCLNLGFENRPSRGESRFDPESPDLPPALLPRSFEKVRRMTAKLRANQFTSFTE